MQFTDPLTRYTSIQGYMYNIAFLRRAFAPTFILHSVVRSGELELTTRWTMDMKVATPGPLSQLWSPELLFTGTSVLSVNPATGKFSAHVDYWDSINDNRYLSLEAVRDLFAQLLSLQKTPDLETPSFQTLLRRSDYAVRRYSSFMVARTRVDAGAAGDGGGFGKLAGYIFGGNASGEKMAMTTPVLQRVVGDRSTSMAFPVFGPSAASLNPDALPAPREGSAVERALEPAAEAVAVRTFGGVAGDADAKREAEALLAALRRDGLVAGEEGWTLARYNDPFTPPWQRRNEVMVRLKDFPWPQ